MRIVKRIVTLTLCIAVCLCMAGRVRARAASIPEGAEVLSDILNKVGIVNDLTGIAYAYNNLTEEQKLICAYLMGAWNNIYLCARGFTYSIPDDENSIKAEFIALGRRALTFALTDYAWRSRCNEVFRQYMSSIIIYASDYDSFDLWYADHKYGGSKTLYIPYSAEAFDAWTVWYNDPSGDGIATFGEVISEWDSGDFYDFEYVNLPWQYSADQAAYNNFVTSYSPVLYSKSLQFGSNPVWQQYIAGFEDTAPPNAIFILNGQQYQFFKYGYSNGSNISTITAGSTVKLAHVENRYDLLTFIMNDYNFGFSESQALGSGFSNIYEFIAEVFLEKDPLNVVVANYGQFFATAYPFIEHVYIVDNLDTLSNPQEIFNRQGLNVNPSHDPHFIITPFGTMLAPSWPLANGDPMNLLDHIIDNSVDVNFDTVSEDDYSKQIVNYTTINNYYVTDSDLINVPVEWFDNPYTLQLSNDSLPFIGFAKDCIDCLGDLDVYMYGALVIGLGGGIVKKLLL